MNIVEAYKLFRGKMIIFVSGLSGCGKTQLARNIAEKFNLTLLEEFNYYNKNFDSNYTLPNGSIVSNRYTDDAIDWNKLNNDINKHKKNGVIVSGYTLPDDKIESKPDVHVHIFLNKNNCLEKRTEFLEKHKDKFPDEYENIGNDTEKLKMNHLIYPYYLNIKERTTINKFYNYNKLSMEEIWDQVWEYLIQTIQLFVEKFKEKDYYNWLKEHPEFLNTISPELNDSRSPVMTPNTPKSLQNDGTDESVSRSPLTPQITPEDSDDFDMISTSNDEFKSVEDGPIKFIVFDEDSE